MMSDILFSNLDVTKMDNSRGFFLSPELLGCFVLGFFLLIAVVTNILLCHHNKNKKGGSQLIKGTIISIIILTTTFISYIKAQIHLSIVLFWIVSYCQMDVRYCDMKAFVFPATIWHSFVFPYLVVVIQKRYTDLQTTAKAQENNYRDSVHLVKVTENSSTEGEFYCVILHCWQMLFLRGAGGLFLFCKWYCIVKQIISVVVVPVIPQRIWPQSSIESGSYNTDYEQHDICPEVAFPLSTFQS